MSIDNLPHIPPNLVRELQKTFPPPQVDENTTFDEVRWKAAQNSVVCFLAKAMELQTDNIALEK